MKVISTNKRILSREFQGSQEWQSLSVQITKMFCSQLTGTETRSKSPAIETAQIRSNSQRRGTATESTDRVHRSISFIADLRANGLAFSRWPFAS
jgi:hypothetical protein